MKKSTKIYLVIGALALVVGLGVATYGLRIDPPYGMMIQKW